MATQKHHKTDLIAIYRLEFYKKQRNWKLSTDARKKKDEQNSCTTPIKNNNILNETYSIETPADNNGSVLNDAFIKEDSDKDTPPSPPAQTSLHTQWLEPINACEECQRPDQAPKAQNPWADYLDDGWTGTDMRCSGDGNEFEGCPEGMVWTNSGITPGWTGDVPTLASYEPLTECPLEQQAAWTAETVYHQLDQLAMAPWPDDQLWVPGWCEDAFLQSSLESIEEFMVGAHSAPHSSEVELCGTAAEGDSMSEDMLSLLSEAELSAAVKRHAGSLRRLLREAGNRKYKSTFSLDLCTPDHFGLAPREYFTTEYSYEAFPTRDVPSTPLSPFCLGKDTLTPLSSEVQPNFCNKLTPVRTNMDNDTFTPISSTNQDIQPNLLHKFTPMPSNLIKDTITPLSPSSQCNFVLQADQCTFTPPSPANMYRQGFLAGSYRNRVAPGLVGRGRGRLQGKEGLA